MIAEQAHGECRRKVGFERPTGPSARRSALTSDKLAADRRRRTRGKLRPNPTFERISPHREFRRIAVSAPFLVVQTCARGRPPLPAIQGFG
jgi:hypothetical protein